MWRMLVTALMVAFPVAGFAQNAVIRIEAKRGQAVANAAAKNWRQDFDNVVTFPLQGGWVGIALGPMKPEQAKARLTELKTAGKIPADSFVSVLKRDVTLQPVGGKAQTSVITPLPKTPAAEPSSYIRLQTLPDWPRADQSLAKWRADFPAAGLWELPNGWFTIALGPLKEKAADAWLEAFKRGGAIPKDAFLTDTDKIGQVLTPGTVPDLPAPGKPQKMPPMTEVQTALQWAGLYDGAVDGRAGTATLSAINTEILGQRFSPDPGTAMHNLLERRMKWREEFKLSELKDPHTGLSLIAPMNRLQFDHAERALSIYAPKADSGAAMILFSQEGGQQELVDLSGLVTALGWVPKPERLIENGHILLTGQNDDFSGHAEGWVRDGRAEGFVLIWPASDALNQRRLAVEMRESLKRYSPVPPVGAAPSVKDAPTRKIPTKQ